MLTPEEIHRAKRAEYRRKNRDKILAYLREYKKANPEWVKEHARKHSLKYADKYSAVSRKYALNNKERVKEINDRWRKNNPHIIASNNSSRRSAEKASVSKWANKFYVREIYRLAKLRAQVTGIAFCVDHIVPLSSEYVCGLHNEFNLQILENKANIRKGNRTWPQMEWEYRL